MLDKEKLKLKFDNFLTKYSKYYDEEALKYLKENFWSGIGILI